MKFRVFVEPNQGATYGDQLAVAQASEKLGFDAFFRSDHFLHMGDVDGLPGPTDAWVTLGALARETSTIRLGTLVTSATFRHPSLLAIQVAQIDDMSQGRVELGLGSGWFEAEHTAYGFPFPQKRFDILEEQLQIVTGLWETPLAQTFSFSGTHYQLTDSPARPKPVQSPVPIIIGGHGPRRTPALAAQFAAEFNTPFAKFDDVPTLFAQTRRACEAIDRAPESMIYSSAFVLCVGATEEEFVRRAAAIGREPEELRRNGLAGTVPEVIDRVGTMVEAGANRLYLQTLDLQDLDHLDLVAREIMPAFN